MNVFYMYSSLQWSCIVTQTECCGWAWEFLTERVGLPKERLYVTYFGGNEKFNLKPDDETKNIWLNLGYVFISWD